MGKNYAGSSTTCNAGDSMAFTYEEGFALVAEEFSFVSKTFNLILF